MQATCLQACSSQGCLHCTCHNKPVGPDIVRQLLSKGDMSEPCAWNLPQEQEHVRVHDTCHKLHLLCRAPTSTSAVRAQFLCCKRTSSKPAKACLVTSAVRPHLCVCPPQAHLLCQQAHTDNNQVVTYMPLPGQCSALLDVRAHLSNGRLGHNSCWGSCWQ